MSEENESSLKLSPLHIAVAIACGRRQPLVFGPTIPGLITYMLATSRHWEQMEEIRAKHGIDSEPSPFHSTVMQHLARINELRVAAQRQEMRRRLDHNAKQMKIARRREAFKPHVSRRVLNERRKQRQTSDEDSSGAEGNSVPVLAGTGSE